MMQTTGCTVMPGHMYQTSRRHVPWIIAVTATNLNVGKLQYVFILRIVCKKSLLYIRISLFFDLLKTQKRLKGRHKLMYTMHSALFNAGNILEYCA